MQDSECFNAHCRLTSHGLAKAHLDVDCTFFQVSVVKIWERESRIIKKVASCIANGAGAGQPWDCALYPFMSRLITAQHYCSPLSPFLLLPCLALKENICKDIRLAQTFTGAGLTFSSSATRESRQKIQGINWFPIIEFLYSHTTVLLWAVVSPTQGTELLLKWVLTVWQMQGSAVSLTIHFSFTILVGEKSKQIIHEPWWWISKVATCPLARLRLLL